MSHYACILVLKYTISVYTMTEIIHLLVQVKQRVTSTLRAANQIEPSLSLFGLMVCFRKNNVEKLQVQYFILLFKILVFVLIMFNCSFDLSSLHCCFQTFSGALSSKVDFWNFFCYKQDFWPKLLSFERLYLQNQQLEFQMIFFI